MKRETLAGFLVNIFFNLYSNVNSTNNLTLYSTNYYYQTLVAEMLN